MTLLDALYPSEVLYPSESLYPADGFDHPQIAVIQEPPPDHLAVTVKDPATGQTVARWAEDEISLSNILSGIHKSGEMPGGHKELTGILSRDPRIDWPDLEVYNEVVLSQAGGENVWEGRLDKAPEVDGQRMAIEPAAVGHSRALEDRKGIIGPGFIDCDLSKWGGPSTQRQVDTQTIFNRVEDGTVGAGGQEAGEVTPGISMSWPQLLEGEDYAQTWYNSGGVPIGKLRFDIAFIGGIGENWVFQPFLSLDDLGLASYDAGPVFVSTNASNQGVAATGIRKYALLEGRYTGIAEGSFKSLMQWRTPKVLGNSGLTPQGEWPEIGFTAKQMLQYAIPLYTYLQATDESIEDDGYVIPQAWFSEPGEMATVVKELTKYGLLDWFVLNGKLFELRKPGSYGRKWQAYAGPSELQEAGIDGTRLWRTIIVRWQDVDGSSKTAGPLGSGTTVESAGLEITDPNHPAVMAGIAREDILDLQGISERKFAIEVGERWLKEANETSHSGQATLRGYVLDDKGIFRPVAQVMPGDQIRFSDAGSGGTGYRKIVQVDYDHDQRSCQVTLDAPKESIQALLERYRAQLSAMGIQ
jgi:hypothetical protein